MLNLKKAELVFFEAMKSGWAADVEKTTIPGLPGYKAIVWDKDGLWKVVDYYAVGPVKNKGSRKKGGMSIGGTTIFFLDRPVWVMHYGGYYREEVIPFLKRALFSAYQDNHFFGGRGPLIYKEGESPEDEIAYFNTIIKGDFEDFKGGERVFYTDRWDLCGWYTYFGFVLE